MEDRLEVLVDIPREARSTDSDGKAQVIRPLHVLSNASLGESRRKQQSMMDSTYSYPTPYYFDLHHRRLYCDLVTGGTIDGGPRLHQSTSLRDLVRFKGLATKKLLTQSQGRYAAYSSLVLPTPTLRETFCERLASPLVVLQLLGKLLQVLEESIGASLISIAQTLGEHYWNARQSIVSAKELADEVQGNVQDSASLRIWVYRPSMTESKACHDGWVELPAVELLPGDVFVWNRANEVMPVDALILDGTCVTNEAVLTGETLPQSKISTRSRRRR